MPDARDLRRKGEVMIDKELTSAIDKDLDLLHGMSGLEAKRSVEEAPAKLRTAMKTIERLRAAEVTRAMEAVEYEERIKALREALIWAVQVHGEGDEAHDFAWVRNAKRVLRGADERRGMQTGKSQRGVAEREAHDQTGSSPTGICGAKCGPYVCLLLMGHPGEHSTGVESPKLSGWGEGL
jgi:hypothetical protein